jgi:predicted nuclease of predicted toxin-antitoxin system
MKILLDMNLSPTWVGFLEQAGFEAVHWASVGEPTASDADIMEWARLRDHVVFTHDMDFSALLAVTGAAGPSVLQVRAQDVLPDAIGRDVVRVLTMRAPAFSAGAIVTIDKVKSRVRVLPIRRTPDDSEPV